MSLIAWYPFTKDFRNQGLSNISESVGSGVSLVNSNKFGTSASFDDTTNGYIRLDNFSAQEAFGQTNWSLAFWINYQNNEQRAVILGSFANSVNSVVNFEINGNSRTDNALRVYWYTGTNSLNYSSTLTLDANTWIHVVIAYNGTDIKFYKNGILVETKTASLDYSEITTNWYIGTDNRLSNKLKGELHDFRIYNHCLSIKEIKELSKGLILHYDLKGYNAGENILLENWLNSGTLEFDESIDRYVHVRDITTTSESYLAVGRTAQVEKSTQYTFSTWVWINDNVKSIEFFWLSDTEENKKTGTSWVNVTSTSTTGDTTSINSKLIPNKWNYVTWTFTTKSDDYTGYIRYDNNGSKTEGEHAILKVYNPKLEKGSVATPYIPYISSSYGFNSNIEEDLSGNGYNGVKQGITYSTDTPRYNLSSEFDANKDLVFTDNRIYHDGDEVSNLSVSIWVNFDSGISNNIWNLNQNGFIRMRPASTTIMNFTSVGNFGSFSLNIGQTLVKNKWYHFILTFDNGVFKFYVNGILGESSDKSSTATTIKCSGSTQRWSLGDYAEGSESFVGKLSDFRIYATTLSTDDVKALYNIGAQIDNSGKLYCGALVEE